MPMVITSAIPGRAGGSGFTNPVQQGFIQVIGNVSVGTTGDTIPVPVMATVTVGNTLIGVTKGSLGAEASSVNDTKNNTWVIDTQALDPDGPTCAIIRSVVTTELTSDDTITVTLSNSSAYNTAAMICEYSGSFSSPDVTYEVVGSSGTTYTATASNATQYDNELVIAGIGISGTPSQSDAFSVSLTTPSMTLRAQSPASPGENNSAIADGIASGIVTPSMKWSWSDSDVPVAVIASYVLPLWREFEPERTSDAEKQASAVCTSVVCTYDSRADR